VKATRPTEGGDAPAWHAKTRAQDKRRDPVGDRTLTADADAATDEAPTAVGP